VSRTILLLALLAAAGCGGPTAQGGGPETAGGSSSSGGSGGDGEGEGGGESAGGGEATGAKPPDFELPTLDGKTARLSDHLGKDVVLIDFWATFCDPCLAAMPHLDELYKKHKDKGFVVYGISIDGPDSLGLVKTEVAKLGVSFPILLDSETRVVALYNPKTSAPYSVLIGRDGNIIVKKEGYTTGDSGALDRDVEAVLAK
jgi:peroxiredoxin